MCVCVSRARGLRDIEAKVLTKQSTQAQYDELKEMLLRRGMMSADCTLLRPQCFWVADEKGVNDESSKNQQILRTKANCKPSTAISKTLLHVPVLTMANASGEACSPAVVMAGEKYHPLWEQSWPNAYIDVSSKGSFPSCVFTEALGALWWRTSTTCDVTARRRQTRGMCCSLIAEEDPRACTSAPSLPC